MPTVSSFMPLVDFAAKSMDDLLVEYLDNVEYPEFPLQKKQFQIIRDILKDPKDATGQFTMAPFQLNLKNGPHCKGIHGMSTEGNYTSIVSVLNHPPSRGVIHINSPDPKAQPTLDPRYFSHPLDLKLHARHTQWLETLAATEPFASLLEKNGRRIHADKPVVNLEDANKAVEENFVSHYHVTSTCPMFPNGPESCPKGLGGVINEPEKAADIIKEDLLARNRARTRV
ncbi:uncharacterized protein L3040_000156 [Drepanopeziza brunnea f. sp. 'multigermtubi']|uniref:uncharacterized protein n=1 Tax=Drepanopeziza brunnea f. sp. 'multigermtubi' TaxID=698441 RepID=UPI002397C538|nr:hypothetical protein L3040_000156 [Drepanopeziza brunnea f. sp. 'multigermtubi']